jgi:hypothetical protein
MLRDLADFEQPLRWPITCSAPEIAPARLLGGYHAAYFADSHVTELKGMGPEMDGHHGQTGIRR